MKVPDIRTSSIVLAAVVTLCGVGSIANGSDQLQSTHTVDVVAANYEQLPPPSEPVRIRWDFSDGTEFIYNLRQTVDSVSLFPGDDSEEPKRMTVLGTMEFKAQGDHVAKIVFTQDEAIIEGVPEDENAKEKFKGRPMVVPGLKEDGTMPSAQNQQSTLFRLLFPLPSEPLGVGQTATIPFQFPVNVFGSPLAADGRVKLTLTGLVYVRGFTCAQIDYVVEVDEVELPEEIETEFNFAMSGIGRYFFDIEAGRLVESSAAVITEMEAEIPAEYLSQMADDGDVPVNSTMRMSNDTLIQLTSD
jgi:hypothetical protein